MLKLFIPKHILEWIDEKRGDDCRAVFILDLIKDKMEEHTK